jgi:hypothetical protein
MRRSQAPALIASMSSGSAGRLQALDDVGAQGGELRFLKLHPTFSRRILVVRHTTLPTPPPSSLAPHAA